MSKSSEAPSEGAVRYTVDGPVATIWFDRPAARNAMTWSMYEGMASACREIANNHAVRVAVLRGVGGKAFIAGTDIEQFKTFKTGNDGVRYEANIADYVSAVAGLEIPTIAVVEGWAVGGGMAIASVCDFRLATTGARFGVPIARTLGNCLSAGNLRVLMAMLGLPLVKRMLLLAEMVPAEELTACGYVQAIAEPDNIDALAADYTQRLANHAPVTMAVTKQALARLLESSSAEDVDLVIRAYGSDDFHEGVNAFVNKRAPQWRGQ